MPDISIVLPTYNEAENIEQVIEEVDKALDGYDFEILVVDDDSPDGTSAVVDKALDRLPRVRLITRKTDKGLVNSIKEGINRSAGDVCVWMDADLSMPAGKIRDLLEKIEGGDDLAVGCRYIEGGGIKGSKPGGQKTGLTEVWKNLRDSEDSFFAVAVSKYGNLFARFILDSRYHDYTSGFYAVRKSVFDDIKLEGEYLDYCISFLYKASSRGYKISEIPVTFTPRKRGKSKTANNILSIFSHSFTCLRMIFGLKFVKQYRPESRDQM